MATMLSSSSDVEMSSPLTARRNGPYGRDPDFSNNRCGLNAAAAVAAAAAAFSFTCLLPATPTVLANSASPAPADRVSPTALAPTAPAADADAKATGSASGNADEAEGKPGAPSVRLITGALEATAAAVGLMGSARGTGYPAAASAARVGTPITSLAADLDSNLLLLSSTGDISSPLAPTMAVVAPVRAPVSSAAARLKRASSGGNIQSSTSSSSSARSGGGLSRTSSLLVVPQVSAGSGETGSRASSGSSRSELCLQLAFEDDDAAINTLCGLTRESPEIYDSDGHASEHEAGQEDSPCHALCSTQEMSVTSSAPQGDQDAASSDVPKTSQPSSAEGDDAGPAAMSSPLSLDPRTPCPAKLMGTSQRLQKTRFQVCDTPSVPAGGRHPLSPLDFRPQSNSSATGNSGVKLLPPGSGKFLRTRSEGCLRLRKRSMCTAFALLPDPAPPGHVVPTPTSSLSRRVPDTPCLARRDAQDGSESDAPGRDNECDNRGLQQVFDDEFGLDAMDVIASPPMAPARPLKRTKVAMLATTDDVQQPPRSLYSASAPSMLMRAMSTSVVPQVDASAPYLLPSVCGKSDSIRRISVETLMSLLDGKVSGVDTWSVIDCRFPFEYEGGHIDGAINMNSFEQLDSMFFSSNPKGSAAEAPSTGRHRHPIVFHCEFSSHRAPAMAMHLRAQDRIANMARYPQVTYPEIYVLDGGYKAFFQGAGQRCVPCNYVRMDHPEYREQCKRELSLRKMSLERSKSATECFRPAGPARSRSFLAVATTTPSSPMSPSTGARGTNEPSSSAKSGDSPGLGDTPCAPRVDGRQTQAASGKEMASSPLSNSMAQSVTAPCP